MVHVSDLILPPTLVAVVHLSTLVFSIYYITLALLSFSSSPISLLMQSVARLPATKDSREVHRWDRKVSVGSNMTVERIHFQLNIRDRKYQLLVH